MLCLTPVLASGAGFAGPLAECAAQTGSRQQAMFLSAAVEEALRSPFHAATEVTAPGETPPRIGTDGPDAPLQAARRGGSADAPTIALTFLTSAVSHGGALLLVYWCALDEYRDWPHTLCYLGSLIPLPTVAAAAALGGVGVARALGVSALGWVGGAATFAVAALATERRSGNPDLILSAAVSSLVHAGIVIALITRK